METPEEKATQGAKYFGKHLGQINIKTWERYLNIICPKPEICNSVPNLGVGFGTYAGETLGTDPNKNLGKNPQSNLSQTRNLQFFP